MKFNANNILSVTVLDKGRAGVPFLNWRITSKNIRERFHPEYSLTRADFAGCGLYGLCFDNELIYIGSFTGNDRYGANFCGDVVATRWWAHIGAITARGHRVHIAGIGRTALGRYLEKNHPMMIGFLAATDSLYVGNGNLSPIRRLLFAARQGDAFLSPNARPEEVLKRFTFVYVKYDEMPVDKNSKNLKDHIVNAERVLIEQLSPICNSIHIHTGSPLKVALSDVELRLRQALEL